jgi:hypothetical protein
VEEKTEVVVVNAAAAVMAVPAAHLSARRLPRVRLALDAVLPPLPPEDVVPQTVAVQPAPQAAAAPTPVISPQLARTEAVSATEPRTVLNPKGYGPPDEIVCRARETLPGSRLPGPVICQPNRVWAALRAEHLDFTEDGKALLSYAAGDHACPPSTSGHPQLDMQRVRLPLCS